MAPILYSLGNNNKKIDLYMFNTDLVLSEYFQLNPYVWNPGIGSLKGCQSLMRRHTSTACVSLGG